MSSEGTYTFGYDALGPNALTYPVGNARSQVYDDLGHNARVAAERECLRNAELNPNSCSLPDTPELPFPFTPAFPIPVIP